MAIIPGGQQIRTSSADADLINRGGSLFRKLNKVYTMDDIVETVNQEGGGSTPYKSLYIKLTQSGSNNPSYSIVSNDTDISITGLAYGTGYTTLYMAAPIDQGEVMVVTGGYKSNRTSNSSMTGFHSGQTIRIITGYHDFSGTQEALFIKDDFGFGGTNSIIVEVRVFE